MLTFSDFCTMLLPQSKEYSQLVTGRSEFYSKKDYVSPNDYFNLDTRNELKNIWRSLIQTEHAYESLRFRLSKRPHFQLREAFVYCDFDRDGVVNPSDVRNMLAEHNFFATEKELAFVMKKFDKDMDQKISFGEFMEELSYT